jgi:branched-chain amino acid transport system ATP-binding protein
MALLEASGLSVDYGVVRAVHGVSLAVDENEIVALIGPNGAGKSTVLKAIAGAISECGGRITGGSITYKGDHIEGLQTDALVKRGMSLAPDGRRLFSSMTVHENLEMGGFLISSKSEMRRRIDDIITLLPRLGERRRQEAGTLSTGEQQMLSIGRALMLAPALLLVDEPSVGLSPGYIELIFSKFVEINKRGTAILMVEQNARMALEMCDRAYLFDTGKIAVGGERNVLLDNDRIMRIYLGK